MTQPTAASAPTAPAPVLSPDDHRHFIERGYVVVKRAVDPDAIAAAVAALESQKHEGTVGAADYKPVRTDALGPLSSERFSRALEELMGVPHRLHPGGAGTDMPRPHQPTLPLAVPGPHIDDDYPTTLPNGWAIGSFLFLTPVRPGGGAFVCWPGSPRAIRVAASRRLNGFFSLARDGKTLGDKLEFLAEPGDLLLFHHLMAHSGTHNSTDPTTRHALLSRHHPSATVVPGDKPFDKMSTVEMANSARYLHERLGDAILPTPLPADAPATHAALAKGLLPLGHSPLCHAVFFAEGRPHLFFVAGDQQAVVRHAVTDDWVTWRELPPLPLTLGLTRVRSLQLAPTRDETVLIASGIAPDGSPRTCVVRSADLRQWAPQSDLPGVVNASGFYTSDYGNKARIRGSILLSIPADPLHPDQRDNALPRLGPTWDTLHEWKSQPPALATPAPGLVHDLFVQPTFGESEYALIADVQGPGKSGRVGPPGALSSAPAYSLSNDCLRFDSPLRPLPGPEIPARQIRVLARGRRFWLVAHLRLHAGSLRLFWGAIDWSEPEPRLAEIHTAADLRAALARTGLV
ncbi:MAG: phytanoyl-CoA dioxygenase family protein [Planctomycetota bacterium]|nr:phytanoyl-CoA dioxygenase family protein [Planctomycetota bacterium]